MRGKGISNPRYGTGDQHIVVQIEVPKGLGGKEKKKLQDAAALLSEKHFPQAQKLQKAAEKFYAHKKALEQ